MQMRLTPNQTILIKRKRKSDIDMAISDLLQRGFVLLNQGHADKVFDYGARKENTYWAKLQCK